MQWWCAAQTAAWSWAWRPYPGVWLFILAVAAAFAWLRRRATSRDDGMRAAGITGILLLWVALDWPIGALGGGYLASLHMVQFLLIALVAPPLLLLGLPAGAVPAHARVLQQATHPLLALLVFIAIVYGTHVPAISDAAMATQWGSFLIDMAWLGGGLLFWWPVVGPGAARERMSPPLRMGYLFALLVFMTGPGAMITFSDVPLFATYELAPRVDGIAALDDQRVAGLLMKVGGGFIIWVAISILFYRWHRTENQLIEREMADVA